MKLKVKGGFTLSEMLLAMAIVGVVAAITIPQLAAGMQKKQAGAILSRAVTQIELGCQNMIQYENSNSVDGSYYSTVTALPGVSITKLAPFIGVADTGDTVAAATVKKYTYLPGILPAAYAADAVSTGDSITGTTTVTPIEDATKLEALAGNLKEFKFQKFGAELLLPDKMNTSATGGDPNYVVLQMLIDTNGAAKKPNMYGKDVFEFHLTNSCKMVPYGLSTYKTECAGTSITEGRSCAARVAAEGWKINY